MCKQAAAYPHTPLMILEGLLPPGKQLVDLPLTPTEFDEAAPHRRRDTARGQRKREARLKGGETPWNSLLHTETLKQLEPDCPGALERLEHIRRACGGYLLAD